MGDDVTDTTLITDTAAVVSMSTEDVVEWASAKGKSYLTANKTKIAIQLTRLGEESPSDAQFLEHLQQIEDAGAKVSDTAALIDLYSKMEGARASWEAKPENQDRAFRWAEATAEFLGGFGPLMKSLPGDLQTRYMATIPNYVRALTGLLRKRLTQIDQESARHNLIYLDRNKDPEWGSCDNAPFTKSFRNMLLALNGLGWHETKDLFELACKRGPRVAMELHWSATGQVGWRHWTR